MTYEGTKSLSVAYADPVSATDAEPPATPREQSAEPIPANGSADGLDGKSCTRCGSVNPATAERCTCGAVLSGNSVARTTGVYARHQPADLLMSADELEAGIVADLGGVENLSTLERSYIRKIRDIEIVTRLLSSEIARNNLLTPAGRVRDVFTAFLAGLDRFDRYSQRLGLKRRARSVTPLEYWRDRQQAQPPDGADVSPAAEQERR